MKVSISQAFSFENQESGEPEMLAVQNLRALLPGGETLWNFESGVLPNKGMRLVLGRNGSGKSTLLRTLLGMNSSYLGSFQWNFQVLNPSSIAYIPEVPIVVSGISVAEWICWYHGISKKNLEKNAPEYLLRKDFSILDLVSKPLSKLSKGQLQKVQIWQALFNKPQVIFFDEPFSGLDPWHKAELVQLMIELSSCAVILVSTHEIPDPFKTLPAEIWLIDSHDRNVKCRSIRGFQL